MTNRTDLLSQALETALRGMSLEPRYEATVELAKTYAGRIDAEPDSLVDLGPKLLAVLAALGMTPGAKGGAGDAAPVASKLDELKQRRQRRSAAG